MADANPAEVAVVLQQIYAELDKIVAQHVKDALASNPIPTHSDGGSGLPGTNVKILARCIYNLCMQSGMPVPKEIVDMMNK
jgi:hypothetical protein